MYGHALCSPSSKCSVPYYLVTVLNITLLAKLVAGFAIQYFFLTLFVSFNNVLGYV